MRTRVVRAISGATALASGLLAGMAAIAAAQAAASVTIACGDVAGLVTAITNANASGPSEIDLAANCTYTLTASNNSSLTQGANGLPIVRKTVLLVGSNTTITRSSGSNFRILEVAGQSGNAASLTLRGITVSDGHTSGLLGNAGRGGCLLATYTGITPTASTLTLASSVAEDCTALAGGGVYAGPRSRLTSDGSSVKNNDAVAGGGAEIASNASATFRRSFVNGNSAAGRGGGLWADGDVSLTSSTLASNTATIAGGGLYNEGSTNLGASYVLGNRTLLAGGGIYNTPSGDLSLAGTRVQNNISVVRGGGLDNAGDALLQNSFVISNAAPIGGGIYEAPSGSIVVLNSLIVGNTVSNCSPLASVPSCIN